MLIAFTDETSTLCLHVMFAQCDGIRAVVAMDRSMSAENFGGYMASGWSARSQCFTVLSHHCIDTQQMINVMLSINRHYLGRVLEALEDFEAAVECLGTSVGLEATTPIVPFSELPRIMP